MSQQIIKKSHRNVSKNPFFLVRSKLGKQIRTTCNYWDVIVHIKHPSIEKEKKKVLQTLREPNVIKRSKGDSNVYLYYKEYRKKYVCVVVRHENGSGFIVTIYFTSNIKKGEIIWKK